MQRFPGLSMQRNPLPTFCPGLHRHQQIVRTRTVLTDQRPTATGIQNARDQDNWLLAISLPRASAIATMTETEIAARATNPTSGGTKQSTKVPVVVHSCTNSHSPELRDCNRSSHIRLAVAAIQTAVKTVILPTIRRNVDKCVELFDWPFQSKERNCSIYWIDVVSVLKRTAHNALQQVVRWRKHRPVVLPEWKVKL